MFNLQIQNKLFTQWLNDTSTIYKCKIKLIKPLLLFTCFKTRFPVIEFKTRLLTSSSLWIFINRKKPVNIHLVIQKRSQVRGKHVTVKQNGQERYQLYGQYTIHKLSSENVGTPHF